VRRNDASAGASEPQRLIEDLAEQRGEPLLAGRRAENPRLSPATMVGVGVAAPGSYPGLGDHTPAPQRRMVKYLLQNQVDPSNSQSEPYPTSD
jgi:hypothetical protein